MDNTNTNTEDRSIATSLLVLKMVETRVFLDEVLALLDAGFVAEATTRIVAKRDALYEDELVYQGIGPELASTMVRVISRMDGLR
jgi:hypothetical protein